VKKLWGQLTPQLTHSSATDYKRRIHAHAARCAVDVFQAKMVCEYIATNREVILRQPQGRIFLAPIKIGLGTFIFN
jgi:hypothetical protein